MHRIQFPFFHSRFTSVRSRLFVAFAGVLLLSLLLTAATFWVQIRIYDTQQVQSQLLAAKPSVFAKVKQALSFYWYTARPNNPGDQANLKAHLVETARTFGLRILLTDYCNHVPIDTGYAAQPVLYLQARAPCSQYLDDVDTAHNQPLTLSLGLGCDQVRQTSALGGAYYLVCPNTRILPYLPPGAGILVARAIILAKAPGSVDQNALSAVLPRLAAAGIVAVLLTLLVVVAIVGAITRPLRTITAASERMAKGDYDQQVPEAGEDEVGQLARSFNRMASEVSTARDLQRQFIANVSHDLKTPLTSILGFSQILTESEALAADPGPRRAAQVINEEARRMQRLTLDLLELSRLEAGHAQLRRDRCDLNELAEMALARYAELPAYASLRFHDGRCEGELPVWGDADRLMRVLVNLLDNAAKFCDPGGEVAVRTERHGADAVLVVANTGAAIGDEDLTRVFQRFYRTDHSRATRTGGSGLGLAIVREIVFAHGGRVEAHSDPDGWTRFTVVFPTASNPPIAAGPGAGTTPNPESV